LHRFYEPGTNHDQANHIVALEKHVERFLPSLCPLYLEGTEFIHEQ
jgi:hypothetical protein